MGFTKIALVGANDHLGLELFKQLLASTSPKFTIAVLTRIDSTSTALDAIIPADADNVKVHKVNYSNHAQLVSALRGSEVIISALPAVPAIELDLALARAGREADVRRIFPSEYTLDILHPAARKLMGDTHPRVQHALAFYPDGGVDLGKRSTLSATTIVSGMFLDLAMRGHHGNYSPTSKLATLF